MPGAELFSGASVAEQHARGGPGALALLESIARSRALGLTGAKPKPQLPSTTDVTPCQPEIVQYGSHSD